MPPPETARQVEQLDSLYESSHYVEAAALAESMLDRGTAAERAHARHQLALCRLQLGRPDLARAHLDAARAHYAASGEAEPLAECLCSEASYAMLSGLPNAVDVATDALVACRALRPARAPLEVRGLNIFGAACLTVGNWASAIDAYEKAIALAEPLYDMKRQARLLNDAALAYKECGRFDEAVRHITRAIALLEVTREPVMLTRSENNLGCILLSIGRPADARPHFERAQRLADETGLEAGRGRLLLSLCELNLAEGRVADALGFATEAVALADRLDEVDVRGQAHEWLGRVAAADGDDGRCDAEFARALEDLAAFGAREWLARCHESYAEVLERRGDLGAGYLHLKAAFRSRTGAVPA